MAKGASVGIGPRLAYESRDRRLSGSIGTGDGARARRVAPAAYTDVRVDFIVAAG